MSAYVLVSGTLFRDPESRVAKSSGKPFTVATLKVKDGDATSWWKALAFNEAAQAELLRLRDGESVSVQGALRVETYDKNGETKLAFTVMADCILALRQAPKPRQTRPKQQEKMERKEQRRPHETAGDLLDPHHGEGGVDPRFDDSIPF